MHLNLAMKYGVSRWLTFEQALEENCKPATWFLRKIQEH